MTAVLAVVSGLLIAVGAVLLAYAIVVLTRPRWYVRRCGRPLSGRIAPLNSAPFTLSEGRKRSGLYFWAGGGAPYDDLVVGQGMDAKANEEWLRAHEPPTGGSDSAGGGES